MTDVLVTGATGDVGASVVTELKNLGVSTRAFVRDAERARELHGEDVELAVGDFGDPETIRRALDGVERVFLACGNDPRQVEYEANVIDAAARADVQRLVKLSAVGAEIGSPLDFWDAHGQIERHLTASGVPGAVLRPTSYMTKLLGPPDTIKRTGMIFAPAGDAQVSLIDPRDVAAVAVATLTEDGHDGRVYALSGPQLISFADIADQLSAVTGRPIEFVDVPEEAARQGMEDAGMPEWLVKNLLTLWRFIREGKLSEVTGTVGQIIGREPRGFSEFARDNAVLF